MVKPKRRHAEAVSLFPFLSILACVIGVLTLMITALAIGQLEEGRTSSEAEFNEEYEVLEQQIEVSEQELERIKRAIADAEKMQSDLETARAELERLQAQQLKMANVGQIRDTLAREAAYLEQQTAEIEAQLQQRVTEAESLRGELEFRRSPPHRAADRRSPQRTATAARATRFEVHTGRMPQGWGDRLRR